MIRLTDLVLDLVVMVVSGVALGWMMVKWWFSE